MSRKLEEYSDLVLLIRNTTKIESTLEALGGSGGGIWEKADSINDILPDFFMQKIIKIGTCRNDAVHGDLKVKNLDFILNECNTVLEILEGIKKIKKLQDVVKSKFKRLHFSDQDKQILLSEEFRKWHISLNQFKVNNIGQINFILDEKDVRLKELNKLILMKRLKIFGVIGGVITLVLLYFSITGYFHD